VSVAIRTPVQCALSARARLVGRGILTGQRVARPQPPAGHHQPQWLEGVARTWTVPIPDLGRELLKFLMSSWADEEVGPTLRAVLQTAAHEPTTREKLRMIVERSLMGVSQLGDDERDRQVRSGLISSQMMGFALMRYVWKIEPVASMSQDEVLAAMSPNLQRYIEGDLSGRDQT
jgi:hypothetical protein